MRGIYGYFNSPQDAKPTYDPGTGVQCPVCSHTLGRHTMEHPIVTISLMMDGDTRSYFYRVHGECFNSLTDEQKLVLDEGIIGARAMTRELN